MKIENLQLQTERLLLNFLSYKDIPKIIEYAANPKIADNLLSLPFPYFEEDAIFLINSANQSLKTGEAYKFAIRIKKEDKLEFIGVVGLLLDINHNKAELGYWIGEPFWNKGLMSEALGKIIEFGFETLQLNKIIANHFLHNPASGKIMIKNRMIKEAEIKDHFKKGDKYLDIIQYRLTKEEYKNQSTKV